MNKIYEKFTKLVISNTAKDTFILFTGNTSAAFLGFLFTLILARKFSVADFGIFSAAVNLVAILTSLADIGISSGSINFISEHLAKNDIEKANEYIKASFIVRMTSALIISMAFLILAPYIAPKLLATHNMTVAIWVAILPIFWLPDMFFPPVLQAKRKFLHAVIFDNSFYLTRLGFAFIFYLTGALTMPFAFWAFGAGFAVNLILIAMFIKDDFIRSKPRSGEYKKLLGFSGWLGVNSIISSISGRLDVQMLAVIAGAIATGLYSIPSRLASFIVVLTGSYSSVLATRLAGFGDPAHEKKYILKSTTALVPISLGILIWILFAKPFITILFGQKYLPAVPVFQALALAQIPFLFTAPAVSAIIYSMKKTVYIGTLAFVQIAAIFLLNLYLIPKYGVFGPTITIGITNLALALYVWGIVLKHYWLNGNKPQTRVQET